MSGILSLDLSKRSTGWGYLADGGERPYHGCWDKLASEYTTDLGEICYRLYKELLDLHSVMPVRKIFTENPVNMIPNSVPTSADSVELHLHLKATVNLFGFTIGAPRLWIHQASWRRHFLGKMQRGTKSVDLKFLAIQQCKAFGLRPLKHDDAEALGLLDYGCELEGITPPWRVPPPAVKPLFDLAAGGGR